MDSTTSSVCGHEYTVKQRDPEAAEFHTLYFDSIITDEDLKQLMNPTEPQTIHRGERGSRVEFFAVYADIRPLRTKLQAWAKGRYNELAPIWEAEREAKFQKYYKSLDMDDFIEIPGITTHRDGRSEPSVHKMKIGG